MAKSNLIEQIIQSIFFKNAQHKAENYSRNTQKLTELVRAVSAKSSRLAEGEGVGLSFLEQISTLARLVRAYVRGEYKAIPWRSLLLIIASLIYFVSPLDFIPDLLPIIGLTDDIALILWVVKSVKEDILRFREWELDAASPAIKTI
ncbi:MAG: YkvA family protein [Bacteroidota bacterium]